MKNPFVKQDNSILIAAAAVGALAAGAIAYLLITKQKFAFRKKLSDAVAVKTGEVQDHVKKKHPKLKKKTTDLHHIEDIIKG